MMEGELCEEVLKRLKEITNAKPIITMGRDPMCDEAEKFLRRFVIPSGGVATAMIVNGKWHKLHKNPKRLVKQLRQLMEQPGIK